MRETLRRFVGYLRLRMSRRQREQPCARCNLLARQLIDNTVVMVSAAAERAELLRRAAVIEAAERERLQRTTRTCELCNAYALGAAGAAHFIRNGEHAPEFHKSLLHPPVVEIVLYPSSPSRSH